MTVRQLVAQLAEFDDDETGNSEIWIDINGKLYPVSSLATGDAGVLLVSEV